MADRFSGYYEHTLDPKGRITIPSKFRDQLGVKIAIMRGKDRCLKLYSLSEWNKVYEKYESVDEDEDPALFRKMRKLLATSEDDNEMDKQGRLLVPPALRSYAGLDKEVVVSGAGRHVEVWDKESFYRFIDEDEEA